MTDNILNKAFWRILVVNVTVIKWTWYVIVLLRLNNALIRKMEVVANDMNTPNIATYRLLSFFVNQGPKI